MGNAAALYQYQQQEERIAKEITVANNADQVQLHHSLNHLGTKSYSEHPQAGLNQTNVDGSKAVGTMIVSAGPNGTVDNHKISDINEITTSDSKLWGYVYATTDHKLFVQQDPSSKSQWSGSVGVGVGPVSGGVGYSPPTGTATDLLKNVEQLPPGCFCNPSNLMRGDQSASDQLLPKNPRAHLDAVLETHHRTADASRGGAVAMDPSGPLNASHAYGSPAVGAYVAMTPAGAQEIERSPAMQRS